VKSVLTLLDDIDNVFYLSLVLSLSQWRAERVRMVRRPRTSSLEGASNDPVL